MRESFVKRIVCAVAMGLTVAVAAAAAAADVRWDLSQAAPEGFLPKVGASDRNTERP